MIDASGRVAAHTGKMCIPSAGHYVGENFSVQEYRTAETIMPESLEMTYWHAVNLGRLDESLPLFKKVFEGDPNWAELTSRLLQVELLEVDDAGLKKILATAPDK